MVILGFEKTSSNSEYHLVNIKSSEVEDTFNDLSKAYEIVSEFEEVIEVIPKHRLKIVAE